MNNNRGTCVNGFQSKRNKRESENNKINCVCANDDLKTVCKKFVQLQNQKECMRTCTRERERDRVHKRERERVSECV